LSIVDSERRIGQLYNLKSFLGRKGTVPREVEEIILDEEAVQADEEKSVERGWIREWLKPGNNGNLVT
jgi:hypothetical protein